MERMKKVQTTVEAVVRHRPSFGEDQGSTGKEKACQLRQVSHLAKKSRQDIPKQKQQKAIIEHRERNNHANTSKLN